MISSEPDFALSALAIAQKMYFLVPGNKSRILKIEKYGFWEHNFLGLIVN